MQTINVFTHYTHKVAWEKIQRQERRQRTLARIRRGFPLPLWFKPALIAGLLCGILAFAIESPQIPAITLAGAAWGGILAWTANKFRERVRKVGAALHGLPIERDDLHSFRRAR